MGNPMMDDPHVPGWRRFTLRWVRHRHTDNAAALSFYALFSIVPLLLLGVTVAGLVMGEKAAHGELHKQLTGVVGPDAAFFLETTVESMRANPGTGPLSSGFALVIALYAGSHVLGKLRHSLNVVNGVEAGDPRRGLVGRLLSRGLCAVLILLFGMLLALGSAAEGFVGYFASRFNAPFAIGFDWLKGYRTASIYLTLALASTLVLKILPRRRPRLVHALAGGAFSAVVAGSLKGGLDFYLRHGLWASVSGAALTLLVVLFWLFLSVQAFLAGAEITAALGRRGRRAHGTREES